MKKLVNQFANDWKGEVEKQKSMSKRAREILLRWGEFSEQYVERYVLSVDYILFQYIHTHTHEIYRAGFLRKESETWIEISRTVSRMFLLLVCPVFMLYLFTFDVVEDPLEGSYMMGSLCLAAGQGIVPDLVYAPLYMEFVSIPLGLHNILDIAQSLIQSVFWSILLRTAFGVPIVPFELLWVCVLSITIGNKIIFGPKIIRTTHPRTKEKINTPTAI